MPKLNFWWYIKIVQTGWNWAEIMTTSCLFLINLWFSFPLKPSVLLYDSFEKQKKIKLFFKMWISILQEQICSLQRQLQIPLDGLNYSICRPFLVLPCWNTAAFMAFWSWAIPAVQCSEIIFWSFFFLSLRIFAFNNFWISSDILYKTNKKVLNKNIKKQTSKKLFASIYLHYRCRVKYKLETWSFWSSATVQQSPQVAWL